MSSVILATVAIVLGAADPVADTVTLRDGSILLGEVVDSVPGGHTTLIIRRAWAREHAAERARRWESAERPVVERARKLLRERLTAWRKERIVEADDRITPWIDRELARLEGVGDGASESPLISVSLGRGEVKSIAKKPKSVDALLRLAWSSGLPEPESMTVDELEPALEGRGFDPSSKSSVALDELLPPRVETDADWRVRRAATEVRNDPGLRFVNHLGITLPEPAPGQPLEPKGALAAVSALGSLLGDKPVDPQMESFRMVSARGRIGAVVTKLDIATDMASVSVELALWVRQHSDNWTRAGARSATVRTDDLGPEAGKDLEADPQVKMVFGLVESIGLGGVPPDVKRRSLNVGAATRKALGQARTLAEADLAQLALPLKSADPRRLPEKR